MGEFLLIYLILNHEETKRHEERRREAGGGCGIGAGGYNWRGNGEDMGTGQKGRRVQDGR